MKGTEIYRPDQTTECCRPLFIVPVSAGLPSPAEDYIEGTLDLNQYLVKHPVATFFVRVSGNSMINAVSKLPPNKFGISLT
ncbi:MAG TPA: S24 family peptidase [Syntrophales bacterium]|nr:S24 family peptidase [Syntrophales bacterium]